MCGAAAAIAGEGRKRQGEGRRVPERVEVGGGGGGSIQRDGKERSSQGRWTLGREEVGVEEGAREGTEGPRARAA